MIVESKEIHSKAEEVAREEIPAAIKEVVLKVNVVVKAAIEADAREVADEIIEQKYKKIAYRHS